MSPPPRPPNLLVLFSDQQRWDTVGANGSPLGVTPNLDALAADGVNFTHAFTPQPLCGPARACLMTGRWATQTGCWRNGIALSPDTPTLPRLVRPAGYDLAYIGKWHLASDDGFGAPAREPANFQTAPVPPERRGGWDSHWIAADTLEFTSHGYGGHMFDANGRTVSWEDYRADALTDLALDYLGARDSDGSPFFLFVSYLEPHHQNDRGRFEGPAGSPERYKDAWVPIDLRESAEPGDWRDQWPDYVGCVGSLDRNVGRVLARLDERGLRENTLVVYTSDHGCHFLTRNWEYKRSCHDASTRVPCIISGLDFRGGVQCDALVNLLDVSATLVTAAGVDVPPDWAGRALQPLATDPRAEWRDELLIQVSEASCGRAIRTRDWLYAVQDPEESNGMLLSGSPHYREAFLYHMLEDPHQMQNRVADPTLADVRAGLRARLLDALASAGEVAPGILPALP